MSDVKLENYDDYDFDADFARDYDQEYDDYEAFKQVQEEPMDEYVEEEVVEEPKKERRFSDSYEKMRDEINREVEAIDKGNYSSSSSISSSRSSDSEFGLGTLFNIFIWACIAVAVVLFIYFIITRQIVTAFLYVIGLIVAFFIGYGLMYVFDNFLTEK